MITEIQARRRKRSAGIVLKDPLRWLAVCAVSALAACQTAPPQPIEDGLVASQGVVDYFEDPQVEQVIAGQGNDIKCKRHRRVGTHLVVRVCRTRSEWAQLREQDRDDARKIRDRCLVAPDALCGGPSGL